MGPMARTKIKKKMALIPVHVWTDRKELAEKLGFDSAPVGFSIHKKLMNDDFKIKQKNKRRGNKYVWELELEDLI